MKQLRVLFQPRPTARSHHGGDVVVMQRLAENLIKLGVDAVIDWDNKLNPSDFNLVHLFNTTLPDLLKQQAQNAHSRGVPFVVTTLLEDVPKFHFQSHVVAQKVIEYVVKGQTDQSLIPTADDLAAVPRAPMFDNSWVVTHASALFTTGTIEENSIKNAYGAHAKTKFVPLGFEVGPQIGPELFTNTFGVKDYVLCVGRLESRKNQLMLLKALENSDLPLVIVEGNITYQPEYAEAVKNFKRKGKTLIVKNLAPEMLSSVYAGAKVHILPSWYELPGLVTLEAAASGAAVVATENSTIRDYLGEDCFYCLPWDAESIRSAVYAGYYAPKNEMLATRARAFTWANTARHTLEFYKEIVPMSTDKHINLTTATADPFEQELLAGEEAARNREFQLAEQHLVNAHGMNPQSTRVLRAWGAIKLATQAVDEAKHAFEQAMSIDPRDAKTLSGLGMCEVMERKYESAYGRFVESLKLNPNQLVPILQLLECSYVLGKYDDLEKVLREYVQSNPDDAQMKFCLAGCLFKQNKNSEAQAWNGEVLRISPDHQGAHELANALKEATSTSLRSGIEKETHSQLTQEQADLDMKITSIEERKRLREYDEAINELNALNPSSPFTAKQRELVDVITLELEIISGNFNSAKERIADLRAKYPQSTRVLCAKGAVDLAEGRWDEGRASFATALEMNPQCDVAAAGLGLWEQHKGSEGTAWHYYKQALGINNENSRALLGAIELGYKLKRLPELEIILTRYADLHPADLDMLYALAGCLFAQGKYAEARNHISTIQLFDPKHARAVELNEIIAQKQMGF